MKYLIATIAILFSVYASGADIQAADMAKGAASFAEMRMEYARRAPAGGIDWSIDDEREAVVKSYSEESPKAFIDGSAKWLAKCPVDAKVHLMRAALLLKAGDVSGHFYHRMMYYGLMASIVTSGDGKTPKTAYKVIAVEEEYTMLRHIGAKVVKQGLVKGPCDEMSVEINGKSETIYFDVSIAMGGLKKEKEKAEKK